MDAISTILSNKDFKEPDEIQKLKEYIKSVYSYNAEVRLNPKGLTILVSSSALASTLRLNLPDIKRQLNITQALSIRIS